MQQTLFPPLFPTIDEPLVFECSFAPTPSLPAMIKSRFLPILTSLSLIATAAFAEDFNTLTSKEKADGWKLLFDGKTTNGWVAIGKTAFPDKGWTVDNGVLVHAEAGGGGDVVTTDKFENFELTFDWIIGPGANSGVKYNLPDPNKNVGFEYQLIDDEHHPDGVRGGRLHQTGSLYDLIEPPTGRVWLMLVIFLICAVTALGCNMYFFSKATSGLKDSLKVILDNDPQNSPQPANL